MQARKEIQSAPRGSRPHPTLPRDEPADPIPMARAWYAIHLERSVDQWLAAVRADLAADITPAFLRMRLHGYLRAIIASLFAPTPSTFIEQDIGRTLAPILGASPVAMHHVRVGLLAALSSELPPDLHLAMSGRIEQAITQVIWGYCQFAMHPVDAPVRDDDIATTLDDAWCRIMADQHPYLLLINAIDDGRLITANRHSDRVLGYSYDELRTMSDNELIGDGTPDDDYDLGVDLLAGRIPVLERTTQLRHRDGQMVPFGVRIWVLRDAAGTARYLASEFRESTDAEDASHWQIADKRFRHLAQFSNDALLTVSLDGTIRYASPSTERNLGADPDEITGTPFADLALEDDRPLVETFLGGLAISAPRGTRQVVVRLNRRDGLWRWFEISGANLLDVPDFEAFSIQARDITDRKLLEDLLGQQAVLDPLTGILNRRGIHQRVESGITRYESTGEQMALMCLDLDHFKDVNDRFGHPTGDQILIEVTERLTSVLGADSLPGRLGGDEFVVIVPATSHMQAMTLARRIVAALAEPIPHGDELITIGCSLGVVVTERQGHTFRSMMRAADAALYQAKVRRDGNPAMGYDPAD